MSESEQGVRPPPRVPTGIAGLDVILGGGLFKGGVYIVIGRPGTGKTILGNQVAFNHVAGGGRVVYATLLSETHGRLLAFMQGMSFFAPAAVGDGVAYVNGYTNTEKDGLAGLMHVIRSAVRERGATLVIIDGMVTASAVAPSDAAFKKFIQELQSWVEMIGCTVLLLTSAGGEDEVRPEQTMVDGVIQLEVRPTGRRRIRQLFVTKFRGSGYLEGQHSYEISSAGVTVYPRLEPALAGQELADGDGERAGFGVPGLDDMLGGGLVRGTSTLVIGGTGSGKSILGKHFLKAGLDKGEVAVAFGFYANPPTLLRRGDELGFAFSDAVKRGSLFVHWEPAAERLLDKLGWALLDLVRRTGAARVLVDGIDGFREAESFDRLGGFFAVLSQELRRLRATSVFTCETADHLPREMHLPVPGLSALSQNIVHLRTIEAEGWVERQLWILKTRDQAHSMGAGRFEITGQGIRVEARGLAGSSTGGRCTSLADEAHIRILVVDDEFSIVESLREILTWEGFEVETAPNGRAALEAVARARPDLIILDVMMPVLDGVTALRALRDDPASRAIPVIVMSAAPLRLSPDRAGYQGVLRKPFDVHALMRTIREVLGGAAGSG